MDDPLDEDAWGVNVVGVDLTGFYEMLDLGDRDLCRRRHDRVEVTRSLAIDEVAFKVGLPGMYDCQVGDETAA